MPSPAPGTQPEQVMRLQAMGLRLEALTEFRLHDLKQATEAGLYGDADETSQFWLADPADRAALQSARTIRGLFGWLSDATGLSCEALYPLIAAYAIRTRDSQLLGLLLTCSGPQEARQWACNPPDPQAVTILLALNGWSPLEELCVLGALTGWPWQATTPCGLN